MALELNTIKNIVESKEKSKVERSSQYQEIFDLTVNEVKDTLRKYGKEGKEYLQKISQPSQAVRLMDLAFGYKNKVKSINPDLRVVASPLYTLVRKYSAETKFGEAWKEFVEAMWKEVNQS